MDKSLLACALCVASMAAAPAVAEAQTMVSARHEAIAKAPRRHTGITNRPMKSAPVKHASVAINKVVNPYQQIGSRKELRKTDASLPEGTLLWESFENLEHQGDITWLPEGWTRESKGDPGLTDAETWGCDQLASPWVPGPADGNYYMGINFSMSNQDEWLISPAVALPADKMYQLSFYAYLDPIFMFKMGEGYVDWEAMEFIKQEIAFDFQVLVSADGGEFQIVRDFANDYMDMSLEDLMKATPTELEKFSVDLGEFSGKTIKVAFRYVGTDGNSMFLDAVSIGLPTMELAISAPLETLYWGFDTSAEWSCFSLSIAQYPAFAPFTFYGSAVGAGTQPELSWLYSDPETTDMTPSAGDELTLKYHTDYSSEFTTRNNLYYPPVLKGSAKGYSETEETFPVKYIQAGGKSEFMLSDGLFEVGLLPFDYQVSGMSAYTLDVPSLGDMAIPPFGYNSNVDAFWTDYTFQGDAGPGDKCIVTDIFNYITPANSPLVVDKVWLNALGRFDGAVEFTCGIYPLVDLYEDDILMGQTISDTPIAKATLLGKDVVGYEEGASSNLYLTLVFDFETPVALSLDEAQAYVVKISGFHDTRVEYFVPMQQWVPDARELAFGWVTKEISFMGETRSSFNPIAYYENEYGPMFCSFAINLGGVYPWLEADTDELVLNADGTCSVALNSYYDGADYTVECPEWATVTVAGRYDQCVLTVNAPTATDDSLGEVTISAPGVKHTFKLTTVASVNSAVNDNLSPVTEVYTTTGVKVATSPENLPSGIYITRHADGSSSKIIK